MLYQECGSSWRPARVLDAAVLLHERADRGVMVCSVDLALRQSAEGKGSAAAAAAAFVAAAAARPPNAVHNVSSEQALMHHQMSTRCQQRIDTEIAHVYPTWVLRLRWATAFDENLAGKEHVQYHSRWNSHALSYEVLRFTQAVCTLYTLASLFFCNLRLQLSCISSHALLPLFLHKLA